MAKENITKFFEAAAADKALAEKLAALAVENGYAFTAAELLELGAARPLEDDEVKKASGGESLNIYGPRNDPYFPVF